MVLLRYCGEKGQLDQNPLISQEVAWPEAEILQEGESIQLQECQGLMPWAGQSSIQPGVHLALKPCSNHQKNVCRQTGEAQALGTILLLLEFKVLWFAGRWFPLFPAPHCGDLWLTPAPGVLDPKFLSLCFFKYHEVPAERFFCVFHLFRF